MAIRVIDILEAIEVQHQYGDALILPRFPNIFYQIRTSLQISLATQNVRQTIPGYGLIQPSDQSTLGIHNGGHCQWAKH
ncbi:hypothetical protein AA0229_1787 [Gluconobacter cerinus NRIC 0229]|nr:hypothetical protein AA0229_1787 [Gluconobacter cerinus NRIC 0229]